MPIDQDSLVQFLPLGLAIPDDHPDRNKYLSLTTRKRQIRSSDIAEITLMSPGDILFLYSDGVYDGSDQQGRLEIEKVVRDRQTLPAKDICNAILDYAVQQDERLRLIGQSDRIDDKTAFVIKRW
jgi:hypothetical protein